MHAAEKDRPPPLIEPYQIPDQYVDGLHSVDRLKGGNFRFNFYVDVVAPDGTVERQVVSKLVAARVSVIQAIVLAAKRIGYFLVGEVAND